MNKYYFNRKPKAAQTEKKEVKKTTSKSKPMFGVYPVGR